MANVEINDLGTVANLVLTDELEIQHTAGGLSKKVTGTQINNLVRANLTTNTKTVYVAAWGSDVTGTGTQANPWASLPYAYSQISPTISNRYHIEVENGSYTWGTVTIKPYVSVNFNNAYFTIGNPVTLDSSWASIIGAVFSWENAYLCTFSLAIDFVAAGAVGGFAFFKNISFNTSSIHTFNGCPNYNSTFLYLENFSELAPSNSLIVTDMFLTVINGIFNDVVVYSNESTANAIIKELKVLNNLSMTMNLAGGNTRYEIDSCTINGTMTIANTLDGVLNTYKTNTIILGTENYINSGSGMHIPHVDYRLSDSTKSVGMVVESLNPINLWGKHEEYGTSMSTTIVAAGVAPSALNFTGSTFNDFYSELGLDGNNSDGSILNATGRDGWFNVSSRVCLIGVGFDSGLEFMHVVNDTNVIEASKTQASAVVPTGASDNRIEITIESDIYLANGSKVGVGVRAIDGLTKNIQIISYTHRVSGSGHG